jgi:hypothetical protein
MKCSECQSENREGAKFCNECGHKFEIVCLGCGNRNRAGSTFCDECGHDQRKPEKSQPSDYKKPQSYTPKFPAEKILTTRSFIEGELKLVTVLFADVSNDTSMAVKLDPEEVHQITEGRKLELHPALGYLFLGELYAGRKEEGEARGNFKAAEEMFETVGMDYRLTKTHEVLAGC